MVEIEHEGIEETGSRIIRGRHCRVNSIQYSTRSFGFKKPFSLSVIFAVFLLVVPLVNAGIGEIYYVGFDCLGTAKILVDESGNEVWPVSQANPPEVNELLPFGSEISVTPDETAYDLNFTGKELDRALELHYFGARYYNSELCRFLSPDPVGGVPEAPLSWNKYIYCRNNPIMRYDPTGMADERGEFTLFPHEMDFDFCTEADGEALEYKLEDAEMAGLEQNFDEDSLVFMLLNLLGSNPNFTGSWGKGSFDTVLDSARYHFNEHGPEVGAKNLPQYIRKAEEFKRNLKGATRKPIDGYTEGVVRYIKKGRYIDIALDGSIVSFGAI